MKDQFVLGRGKLNFLRTLKVAVITAAFLALWGFTPVTAQTQERPAEETAAPRTPIIDESAIILGEAPGPEANPLPGTSSILTILRMILVLALAALAVYGVVFFIKRASRPPAEQDPHLRVLARVNLGGTSSAAVLAVGTKAWLVGSSEGGVSLIAELEEQEALDALFLAESERNEETGRSKFPDFRSLFRKVRQDIPPPPGPSIESIRQRRERMRGL